MTTLETLFEKFGSRKKRWESDCLVLTLVFEEYRIAQDEDDRCRIIEWALPILEKGEISPLAHKSLLAHLNRNRHTLSKEHLSKFRQIVRDFAAARKNRKVFLFMQPPKKKKK